MAQQVHKGSNPRIPPETRALAQDLFLAGAAASAIAAQIGVPVATVRTWSKRYKWRADRAKTQQVMAQINGGVAASVAVRSSDALLAVARQEPTDASNRARQQLQEELEAQLAALRRSPVLATQLGTKRGEQGRAAIAKTLAELAAIVHPDWDTTSSGVIIMGELRGSRDAIESAPVVEVQATVERPAIADAAPVVGGDDQQPHQ